MDRRHSSSFQPSPSEPALLGGARGERRESKPSPLGKKEEDARERHDIPRSAWGSASNLDSNQASPRKIMPVRSSSGSSLRQTGGSSSSLLTDADEVASEAAVQDILSRLNTVDSDDSDLKELIEELEQPLSAE